MNRERTGGTVAGRKKGRILLAVFSVMLVFTLIMGGVVSAGAVDSAASSLASSVPVESVTPTPEETVTSEVSVDPEEQPDLDEENNTVTPPVEGEDDALPEGAAQQPAMLSLITGAAFDAKNSGIKVNISSLKLGGDAADENTDTAFRTGNTVPTIVTFGTASQGTEPVGDDLLVVFRVDVLEGTSVLSAVNNYYTVVRGDVNGPIADGADDGDAAKDHYWVIWKGNTIGATASFSVIVTPASNKTTDDGAKFPISVTPYLAAVTYTEGGELETVTPDATSAIGTARTQNYVALADQFRWNAAAMNPANPTYYNTNNNILNNTNFNFYTNNAVNADTAGYVYAGSAHIEYTMQMPFASYDEDTGAGIGEPLILVEADGIAAINGATITPVPGKTFVKDGKTYITEFTVSRDITSTDITKELTDAQAGFKFTSAIFNKAYIINNLKSNNEPSTTSVGNNKYSEKFYVKAIASNSYVTSAYNVKDGTVAGNNGGKKMQLDVTQAAMPIIAYHYYNNVEITDTTVNSFQAKKAILSIGANNTNQTQNDTLSAFTNSLVTYSIGFTSTFQNKQAGPIDLAIKDTFDKTHFQPVMYTLGVYGGNLSGATVALKVTYEDDSVTTTTPVALPTAAGGTLNVPQKSGQLITGIEFIYAGFPSNAQITTAPTLSVLVSQQPDSMVGEKMPNKMDYSYTYNHPDFGMQNSTSGTRTTSTANFVYFFEPSGLEGARLSNGKSANNITRPGIFPVAGDVLEYTITIENKGAVATALNEYDLNDTYDKNQVVFNNATSTAGNAENMEIWYTASGGSRVKVTNFTTEVSGGKLIVHFGAGTDLPLNTNDKYELVYTMQVKTGATSYHNEFAIPDKFNVNNGDDLFWGEFTWIQPVPVPGSGSNKTVKNVSDTIEAGAYTTPVMEGDTVEYTINVTNPIKEDTDWNSFSVNDTFSVGATGAHLEPLSGTNVEFTLQWPADTDYDSHPTTMSAPLSGTAKNQFTLNFSNLLKKGDTLTITYKMKVTGNIAGDTYLINTDYVLAGGSIKGTGEAKIGIDQYGNRQGHVGVIKSANAVGDADTKNMLEGDKINYTVDVANYQTRTGRKVHTQAMVDVLPEQLKYVDGTMKVELVEIVDANRANDVYTEITGAVVAYDEDTNTIKVTLPSAQVLTSEGIKINNAMEAKYHVRYSYTAIVDYTDDFAPTGTANIEQKNMAYAFFVEPNTQIVIKDGNNLKGDAIEDTTNMDGVAATQSYITNSASISLYNPGNLTGGITKKVLANGTVNVPAAAGDEATRKYEVDIFNKSLTALQLAKVMDRLPLYESYKNGSMVITEYVWNSGTSSYDATPYTSFKVSQAEAEISPTLKLNQMTITHTDPAEALTLSKARTVTTKGSDGKDQTTYKLSYFTIVYETTIDETAALEYFKTNSIVDKNDYNYASLYLFDATRTMNIIDNNVNTYGSAKADNGADDWDSDTDTVRRYQNHVATKIHTLSPSPFLGIKAYQVLESGVSETYFAYNISSTKINPGDYVAWEFIVGNANNGDAAITDKAQLAVILPKGLAYAGLSKDASGNPVVPAGFANSGAPASQTTLPNGSTLLVWDLDENVSLNANGQLSIRIRTSTATGEYTSYTPIAYWIPDGNDLGQTFYTSVVNAATQKGTYGYVEFLGDLTDYGFEEETHAVLKDATVYAMGSLGLMGKMTLTDGSKTVTSDGPLYDLSTASRDNALTYTMMVTTNDTQKGLSDAVIISRLPSTEDKFVSDDAGRGSEADARLTDGVVTVQSLKKGTTTADTNFDATKYVVEYYTGAADAVFTDADWKNADNANWKDAAAIGTAWDTVTAVRVRLINGYKLPDQHDLKISYQAKLFNYHTGEKLAYASFGYSGNVNGTSVLAEPTKIGVKAPVKFDRVTVVKVLNDTASTPKMTTFEMDLSIFDSSGNQVGAPVPVQVTVSKSGDTWKGSAVVPDLAMGQTYTLAETAPQDFLAPQISIPSVKSNKDGTKDWTFTVTNTPVKHKVVYDANGGSGSQADANSPYYPNDTVVVLNQGGITRSGYTFKGWNTSGDGSGTSYAPGANVTITADIYLYAQWEQDPVPPGPSSSSATSRPTSSTPPATSSTPSDSSSSATVPVVASSSATSRPTGGGTTGGSGSGPTDLTILGIPAISLDGSAWALLNLILTIAGIVVAIVLIIGIFTRGKRQEEDDEYEDSGMHSSYESEYAEEHNRRGSRGILWRLLATATAIISLVVFLLTENLSLPMVWVDSWTLLMALLAIVETIFVIVLIKTRKPKDDDEEYEDDEYEINDSSTGGSQYPAHAQRYHDQD